MAFKKNSDEKNYLVFDEDYSESENIIGFKNFYIHIFFIFMILLSFLSGITNTIILIYVYSIVIFIENIRKYSYIYGIILGGIKGLFLLLILILVQNGNFSTNNYFIFFLIFIIGSILLHIFLIFLAKIFFNIIYEEIKETKKEEYTPKITNKSIENITKISKDLFYLIRKKPLLSAYILINLIIWTIQIFYIKFHFNLFFSLDFFIASSVIISSLLYLILTFIFTKSLLREIDILQIKVFLKTLLFGLKNSILALTNYIILILPIKLYELFIFDNILLIKETYNLILFFILISIISYIIIYLLVLLIKKIKLLEFISKYFNVSLQNNPIKQNHYCMRCGMIYLKKISRCKVCGSVKII